MFTDYTWQDWTPGGTAGLIEAIIGAYRGSPDFRFALDANRYYAGDNVAVGKKVILEADVLEVADDDGRVHKVHRNLEVAGNRVRSSFLRKFVKQQASFLLGNGVTLAEDAKKRLGPGFDTLLAEMGELALVQGVCWGFFNCDRLEVIEAARDEGTGAVALLDERTGEPMALLRFWQVSGDRPQFVQVFEPDGVTLWQGNSTGGEMRICEEKRSYITRTESDAAGTIRTGGRNWGRLPVFPLYANRDRASELSPAIKSKIDLFDRIASDFGDNLDKTNDVYWVLQNYGGNTADVLQMLKQIRELKAVASIGDGTGSSTAEPHSFEVPYEARKEALALLEKQLHSDYMAVNMDELTGGSLTNVAIKAALMNLNLKADAFEFECFRFVQGLLEMLGIGTEEIRFTRQSLINASETVGDIYLMRQDIDRRTALRLNPYINPDEIEDIVKALAEEKRAESTLTRLSVEDAMFGEEGGVE